jgi:hypothetical protein
MTRKVGWVWHIAYVVAEGSAYRILVQNLKEVNYFQNIHRLKNNIKMCFKEIGREVVHWINVTQDRAGGGLL